MSRRGLDFGIFLAPFHRLGENPTLGFARDLELIEWLDHLGYDEAWIGEHHSAGWETIAAPEIFMAAAAERTRHIRLGSGVTSLPYHNPIYGCAKICAARPHDQRKNNARLWSRCTHIRRIYAGHRPGDTKK